mgnify:FL=1
MRSGETTAHQGAKQVIIDAARAAGWDAQSEVIGDGWRADVLAVRGAVKIAFEVQWSFLSLDGALARQDRYERDGVRGCWFFRTPPAWMLRDTEAGSAPTLKAWKRLPLFHLYPNADGSFAVELNGIVHSLFAFVAALLSGQIHYCGIARAAAGTSVTAAVTIYDARCPACGHTNRVHSAEAPIHAACGVVLAPQADLLTFHPAVLAARSLPTTLTAFTCAACHEPMPAESLRTARYGIRREPSLSVPLTLEQAVYAPFSHWCSPTTGEPCC